MQPPYKLHLSVLSIIRGVNVQMVYICWQALLVFAWLLACVDTSFALQSTVTLLRMLEARPHSQVSFEQYDNSTINTDSPPKLPASPQAPAHLTNATPAGKKLPRLLYNI